MAIVDQWMPIIDLNFEILMGGTGDPPVPDGHWPDGTGRTLMSKTGAQNNLTRLSRFERRVAALHRPVACATQRNG